MTTYATFIELQARVSATYESNPEIAVEADAMKLLRKASEVIDRETLGRAYGAWLMEEAEPIKPLRAVLSTATCDQVEFWLEVGEEHDVSGLKGSMVAGRVQVHPVSPVLAPRARRTLSNAGLLWLGVRSR